MKWSCMGALSWSSHGCVHWAPTTYRHHHGCEEEIYMFTPRRNLNVSWRENTHNSRATMDAVKRAFGVLASKLVSKSSTWEGMVSLWSDRTALRNKQSSWALEGAKILIFIYPKPQAKTQITLPLLRLLSPFSKLQTRLQSHLLNLTLPTTLCHPLCNSHDTEFLSINFLLILSLAHTVFQAPLGMSIDLLVLPSLFGRS